MISAGSEQLTRVAAAYITSIVFAVAFLAATFSGVDGLTALWRSVLAAGGALLASHLLVPPVVDVVLSAIARDEAARRARLEEEDESR